MLGLLSVKAKYLIMRTFVFFISLTTAISLQACGQDSYDSLLNTLYEHNVPVLKADSLKEARQQHNLLLLDTRTTEEYRVSRIEGARHISYDEFSVDQLQDVPKDQPIVLYCTVGYRSERVGEKLQEAGYHDVSNLYGGILSWKNAGYEVVNPRGQPTDSVHTYSRLWSVWLRNGKKVY
jgi:rhodanese-related sulfurtransferase